MGTRGPVGKRVDQKLGHISKAERESVTKVSVGGGFTPPMEPEENWHPIAKNWFRSLANSGQVFFYEPSDWHTAYYVAEAMDRSLNGVSYDKESGKYVKTRFSGQLFSAIMSGMASLLVTEGDRRRVGVELERAMPIDSDKEAAEAAMADYLNRFSPVVASSEEE